MCSRKADFAEKTSSWSSLTSQNSLLTKRELANRALAEQYKIGSFPTVLVLDVDGSVVHREEGFGNKNAQTYTTDLKQALGK